MGRKTQDGIVGSEGKDKGKTLGDQVETGEVEVLCVASSSSDDVSRRVGSQHRLYLTT